MDPQDERYYLSQISPRKPRQFTKFDHFPLLAFFRFLCYYDYVSPCAAGRTVGVLYRPAMEKEYCIAKVCTP